SRRPRLKPGLQHLGRAARGGPRCCATLDPPSVVPIRPVYAVQRVSHCSAWTSGLTGEGRLGRLTATPGGPAPTRAGRWAAAGKIHGETGGWPAARPRSGARAPDWSAGFPRPQDLIGVGTPLWSMSYAGSLFRGLIGTTDPTTPSRLTWWVPCPPLWVGM